MKHAVPLSTVVARALIATVVAVTGLSAQMQKPLVNADVVEMVKNELPESTIIAAIQANPTNFDVSPTALIALKNAGVSEKLMNAMLTESKRRSSSSATSSSSSPSGRLSFGLGGSSSITVAAVSSGARQPLTVERARITETRTRATSMGALSKDKVIDEAAQVGIHTAVAGAHIASGAAGTAVNQGAGVLGQVVGSATRKPNDRITYVWALAPATSPSSVGVNTVFEITMGKIIGVNPDDYAPVIVQLSLTEKNQRLVGATEGKSSAIFGLTPDWSVYESFVEDRVPADVQRTAPGQWQVSAVGLPVGDYAIVLRPLTKSKKYAGRDIANGSRDGQVFDSVWAFQLQ